MVVGGNRDNAPVMATGDITVLTVRPLANLSNNLHSWIVLFVHFELMATQWLASVVAGPPMMLISKYQAPASPLKKRVPLDRISWLWNAPDFVPFLTVYVEVAAPVTVPASTLLASDSAGMESNEIAPSQRAPCCARTDAKTAANKLWALAVWLASATAGPVLCRQVQIRQVAPSCRTRFFLISAPFGLGSRGALAAIQ
jgi:hypothetical protein